MQIIEGGKGVWAGGQCVAWGRGRCSQKERQEPLMTLAIYKSQHEKSNHPRTPCAVT